jgi:ABC-2 type transport system ATP-binding protein
MNNLITIKDLTFQYTPVSPLLSEFTLSLEAGRIYGLLGKNGEGKSTLLKLISGLVFPKQGVINVMGMTPQLRAPELLSEIYFLPEELYIEDISIKKYGEVYAPFYSKFNHQQFDSLLSEFEVDRQKSLKHMSHGQKKKAMIAFGLATNTSILLLDEPTNGLDIPSKSQFRRLVAGAMNKDRCLIISSHQVRDLDGLIDHICIMDHHKIALSESIESIKSKLIFEPIPAENSNSNALYTEETLHAIYQVRAKKQGESESKTDIEILFNACLVNKFGIQEVFSSTNYTH